MSDSYYADATVTIHHGDCLDVLSELPDASVDAVVTDPPYGLEFMGKEWDGADGFRRSLNPADVDRDNPFGRTSRTSPEYRAGQTFGLWCLAWATECLRVLKPGGHMLAFGGTRTSHRLACAVEDAGFEIRDSIAWLYGSGFPKSLDVSKAIDRLNGKPLERMREFGAYVRAAREAAGLTQTEVNRAMQMPQGCGWWEGKGLGAKWDLHLPSAETWQRLKGVIPTLGDDWDWFIDWAEAEREKIGTRTTGIGTGRGSVAYIADSDNRDLTAPATPDAERWQGWGTALKPAWEIVIAARKPHAEQDILAKIGSWLAQAADPTTPTGAAVASSAQTDTSPSVSTATTSSNIVTSWHNCWAEICEATSTSTTETTSGTTTDLTTLWSCLSRITDASTQASRSPTVGLRSLVELADNLFAVAVLNSRVTRTLTATETATSETQPTSPAGGALSQIVVARKPLGAGTVAANVLAHGTGALNVDGCRVGRVEGDRTDYGLSNGATAGIGYHGLDGRTPYDGSAGRWPSNVVLDESQAAALDAQSGETSYNPAGVFGTAKRDAGSIYGDGAGLPHEGQPVSGYGDTGGASRFFYTAKAASSERVRIPKAGGEADMFAGSIRKRCTKCGKQEVNVGTSACACPEPDFQPDPSMSGYVSHPTVKPLTLMRWLVRLVTPPGGTVLEPFAGSGTTVEACILEGFACIAIEREADYLPLIRQRIHRRRDPVEAVRGSGEDAGLFDLLGGEGGP